MSIVRDKLGLTEAERFLLRRLRVRPMTTSDLNTSLPEGYPGINTYGAIHQHMRKLENKEFVRRIAFNPNKWELTSNGRQQLLIIRVI